MSEANEAAQDVIASYRADLTATSGQHGSLIAELEAELVGVAWEQSEAFMDFADALSASLGADAANACEDAVDQEEAIGVCETFVSNEVNATAVSFVTAVVESHGLKAAEFIQKVVSEAPLRDSFDAGR